MFGTRIGMTFAGAAMLGAGAGFLLFLPLIHARRSAAAAPAKETSVSAGALPELSLPDPDSDTDLPAPGYLLLLKENTLYLYEEGSREAFASYELPAGIPDCDRILLEYGMKVASEDELRGVLEDLVS
jgi:hypothetical protein